MNQPILITFGKSLDLYKALKPTTADVDVVGLSGFKAENFVTRDPIGYAGGINVYNNYFLLNGGDPSGNDCCLKTGSVPAPMMNGCAMGKDGGDDVFGLTFKTEYWFTNNPESSRNCCCNCCSFRQYVKSTIQFELEELGGITYTPSVVVNLRINKDFEEDCDFENVENGPPRKVCYGHRDFNHPASNYGPDVCQFNSTDSPYYNIQKLGLKLLRLFQDTNLIGPFKGTLLLKNEFKFQIIDTCKGDNVIQENLSTMDCKKSFSFDVDGNPIKPF